MDFVLDTVIIVLASFLLSIFSQLSYKFLTNQEEIKKINEKLLVLRDKLKTVKDDKELLKIQDEILSINFIKMRQLLIPLILNLIVIVVVYNLIGRFFSDYILLKLPFSLPLVGNDFGWFSSIVIFSTIFTLVIKKVVKVHS